MSTPNTDRTMKPGGAASIAKSVALEPESHALLQPTHSVRDFVNALAEAGHHPDAIKLLAHGLPRREGVWWASRCIRAVPAVVAEPLVPVLEASEKWVVDPTDENRRAAFTTAEPVGFGNPVGLTALATFWCEGSMGPPEQQAVTPDPRLAPDLLANAVVLAAVSTEPELAPEKYATFFGLAYEVAAGTNRWKAAKPEVAEPVAAPKPPLRSPPPPPSRGYY